MLAKVLWHYDLSLDREKTENFLDQKIWSIWAKRELWMQVRVRSDGK